MAAHVRPDFSLSANGQDRSSVLRDRLLRLTLTDAAGAEADELTLEFDDRALTIAPPRKGARLTVAIGWEGQSLTPAGVFIVDETESSGPPDHLTVRAKAADMAGALKAAKSRSWRATTLGAIVAKVASEHGLKPACAPALQGVAVAHLDQAGESDLHFLTRLGQDHGATAAPKDGRLVFAPVGAESSASGAALSALTLGRADLIRWRAPLTERSASGSVRARWRDHRGARDQVETAGTGQPVQSLRHVYSSREHARRAAEAALDRGSRDAGRLDLDLPGRPDAFAAQPIDVSELRGKLNGRWFAERVEHEIDWSGGGFTTRIEAKRRLDPPATTETTDA